MKVLVLSLLNYQVEDEKTGSVIAGSNLNYVSPDSVYDNLNYFGYYPSKVKIDEEVVKKFKLNTQKYPFSADLKFDISITPKGKAVPVLKEVTDIKSLDIF